jgi:putative transcriptional regulator
MSTVRSTLSEKKRKRTGRVDLARVRSATDADIDAMIESDPDAAPDMTGTPGRWVLNPAVPNLKAIRRKLGLSQAEFAARFGFSVRTLQDWEQKRSVPDRPARILLRVIEKSPRAVERAVAAG